MRRFVALLLSIPLTLMALAGCSAPAPACVPQLEVTPNPAHPGDRVQVRSSNVCGVAVPREGWRVDVSSGGEQHSVVSATTSQAFDGTFSVTVTLPNGIAEGDASAHIQNWDYSTCPDDASCIGASGYFTIVAR